MTDPVRIREAGSDAPDELRELFRGAAKPEPLSPALGAMLSSRVGAIATAPASTPLVVKVLPWLLGGTVALGVATYRVRHAEPPAPREAPAALAPAPPLPAAPVAEPEAPPSRAVARRPVAPPGSPSAAPPEDGLVGEERILNEAHEALAANPRRALALAHGHARRYPRGQLVAERELIEIEALVKLGRRREANALARTLRATAPNSIYEHRLDEMFREK